MKQLFFYILVCLFCSSVTGQKRIYTYKAETGGTPKANRLPFWLYTNNYGKITQDAYFWGNAGLFSDFQKKDTRKFDYAFGFEGTGLLGKDDNHIFINQLYGRLRWQNLRLDAGMINRPIEYDGLSASNGDMLWSTNTRSIPGISFSSNDYIKFPWIKWLAFRFRYAEYYMTDKRVMGRTTHLHNKMGAIRLTPSSRLNIEVGIEDYAQWGGKNRYTGIKAPNSLKNYLDIILIRSGREDANESDQINKLGNHIGQHFLRIHYDAPRWEGRFYYNHMFEDGSGQDYKNWPDGLYGIFLTRKEGKKIIKSFLYEIYYTKSQSGKLHERPATDEERDKQNPNNPFYGKILLGGNDNYFNHSDYQSGWTLYGRTIGAPFFTPVSPDKDGVVRGIYNNRFIAHHFGLSGTICWDIQYKLLFSYSVNYGTHSRPFVDENSQSVTKSQYSFGAEFIAPDLHIPVNIGLNIGFDQGDLLKNKFGIMLRIFKTGLF